MLLRLIAEFDHHAPFIPSNKDIDDVLWVWTWIIIGVAIVVMCLIAYAARHER